MSLRRGGALLLLGLAACAGPRAATLAPDLLEALRASDGAYVGGGVRAVVPSGVLEDRDFVYAAAFSPDGARVAYVHLGGDGYRLAVVPLDGTQDGAKADAKDAVIGAVDFDIEGLAFTPDGARLVTAGREGLVRLHDPDSLAILALGSAGAPLTSVAVHPSGRWLAAGDVAGTVHVFSLPELRPLGELSAHRDEVHGLAFTPQGALVSGGWDRTVAVHDVRVERVQVKGARLRPVREDGQVLLRAAFNERAELPLQVDARVPFVVLKREPAGLALDVPALTETVDLPTSMGTQRAPLARGVRVRFRELVLTLDVAICDACVPKGAQGVLGAPFAEQVAIHFDAEGAAVLTLQEGQAAPEAELAVATERARHDVGAHVNALSLDASGRRVALALSEARAVRTREVYQREKDGKVEPAARGNAAVVLRLEDFGELARQAGHRGVVSAVGLSPDGETLASGGWDRQVLFRPVGTDAALGAWKAGWSIRELRFARDGRRLVAAAWTPIVATGDGRSAPSVQLFTVDYATPQVMTSAGATP